MWFMKSNVKYTIIGVIIGVMLSGGIAYAAANDYVLSLFQAKLIFDGVEKQGSEKPYMYYNGREYVPTSLIYNGTTYVPLRFFSEASGLDVNYVGEKKTLYIGQMPDDDKVERYFTDVLQPYYTGEGDYCNYDESMYVAGKEYTKGFQINKLWSSGGEAVISFNLDGKYQNIKGIVGLDDKYNDYGGVLSIYGDDELITQIQLKAGSLSQSLDINVKGVLKLDIKYKRENYYKDSRVDLVDLMIK